MTIGKYSSCSRGACALCSGRIFFLPSNEIIPSWNISFDEPGTVFVYVRAGNDSSIGKWQLISVLGNVSKDVMPCIFEDDACFSEEFKLDIDIILSKNEMTFAELAFISQKKFYVDTVNVAFLPKVFEFKDENEKEQDIFLNVPLKCQFDEEKSISGRICSATSLSSVMSFYGRDIPVCDVACEVYDPAYDLYGVWNRNIQAAYKFGFKADVRYFFSYSQSYGFLKENIPVIACISYKEGELTGSGTPFSSGHVVVVCGFFNDKVVVMDPACRGKMSYYDKKEFSHCWFGSGGVGYLICR